jgi:Protein of unknown function (DUF3105)
VRLAIRRRGRAAVDRDRAKLPTTPLERVAIGLASLALSFGLIAVLSGFFAGRDKAGVSGPAGVVGQQFKDLGHAHLRPGEPRPAYNSNPPTSGAHIAEPVLVNESRLNVDQLLEALEVGDVVITYGGRHPPPGLQPLARSLGGRFTPSLAAAGQAVLLARRPGTTGLIALAWTRMLRVATPSSPLLRGFTQQWLGRGATGPF